MKGQLSESVSNAIAAVLCEILDGPDPVAGWLLNPGDVGLLKSLDSLSAEQASVVARKGGSSIAAHAEHLRYGLELLNRWSRGESPFTDADWTAAWTLDTISEHEWDRLRTRLREEAENWKNGFRKLVDAGDSELTGVLASAAHLAYHLGIIRQINPSTRGRSTNA